MRLSHRTTLGATFLHVLQNIGSTELLIVKSLNNGLFQEQVM